MISKENVKKFQILPKKFFRKMIFIKSVCLKLEKNLTGTIIKYLNDLIKLCKVIVSNKHFVKKNHSPYRYGSLNKNKDFIILNEEYNIIDINFLKRVKSYDEKYNLVLISSKEVR